MLAFLFRPQYVDVCSHCIFGFYIYVNKSLNWVRSFLFISAQVAKYDTEAWNLFQYKYSLQA